MPHGVGFFRGIRGEACYASVVFTDVDCFRGVGSIALCRFGYRCPHVLLWGSTAKNSSWCAGAAVANGLLNRKPVPIELVDRSIGLGRPRSKILEKSREGGPKIGSGSKERHTPIAAG